jgi:hypothetical protein
MLNEVTLGKRYRDVVSGFIGIATATHTYLNGCIRVSLTPPVDADGKKRESEAFDIQELVLVDDGVKESVKPTPTGGPQSGNIQHR